MLALLLTTAALGVVLILIAHTASVEMIQREATRAVGIAADARRTVLLHKLEGQHDRAQGALSTARLTCGRSDRPCLTRLLSAWAAGAGALGARLELDGVEPVTVGMVRELADLSGGVIARVVRENGTADYTVRASSDRDALIVTFDTVEQLGPLFANREGLGSSGESFLADSSGFFLTSPRYHSHSGHSHPIDARPMRACLSGEDGERIAPDYRGADVLHGYRYVPEIGGGCIMAHVDATEAMAPARELGGRMALTLAGFLALGLVFTRLYRRAFGLPLGKLTRRARDFEAGDVESEVPVEGPAEVRAFARAFQAMARSVTEHQRRLKDAVKHRDEFISMASHELRTPMATLALQFDAIDRLVARADWEALKGGRLARSLRANRRQLARLQRLIEKMLEGSRIQAGRLALNLDCVQLAAVVDKVLADHADELRHHGQTVTLNVAPDLPNGRWDRFRLEQVVTNLLSNAIKYGSGKPIAVTLAATDGAVFLEVSDEGIGIAPGEIRRIFEPYERGAGTRNHGGLGLGLFIVQRIVEAHGGAIHVESEVGQGTTFTVELPLSARGPSAPSNDP